MRRFLSNHLHFILVTTALMLVMTFPTIVYVFRTDVFWLPAKHCCDVFLEFWDIWYTKQILAGQTDLYYTNTIFYPEGVSQTYNQVGLLYSAVVIALQLFMPLSNAYSLAYLFIIFTSASAAYLYLHWLFKDRWLALFGAVVFGLSPYVVTMTNFPQNAWLAPAPLVLYGVHRGFKEKRASLIIFGGIVAGLTSDFALYTFVSMILTLALFICGLAVPRWRDRLFWRRVMLLLMALTLASAWRVVPMLLEAEQIDRASGYTDSQVDLLSFFVNEKNPVLGPLAKEILQISEKPKTSEFSYIGLAPIALICFGLANKRKRRQMAPWLILLLVFMVLSLGSTLSINGIEYEDIKLPKHFLNQLLPSVFAAFYRPPFFMSGAWLPVAVLACLGLATLLHRRPLKWRSLIVLAFTVIVAFEYYSPIPPVATPKLAAYYAEERLAFLDWLESEPQSDISLINLPFGKFNSWRYSWFQSLSGYPQVEGYLSRTPDSAYDYIGANFLLGAWHASRPIHCDMSDQARFLAGLAQLEADGFSHIIYHHDLHRAPLISESFRDIQPAYQDPFVSIYRLGDLRDGCPRELGDRHHFTRAYADALNNLSIAGEGHETLVILPPTAAVGDHFTRYLSHFDPVDRPVVVVSSNSQGPADIWSNASIDLERQNAVWLLKDRLGFAPELTQANVTWFQERFKLCEQIYGDATFGVDSYVQLDIPCAAVNSSSALDIRYQDGVRLRNASVEVNADVIRIYLAWTNTTSRHYSFSIQFFGEDGQSALQQDRVIPLELLTIAEIDKAQLPAGPYDVRLIVYDFDTGKSQSGTVQTTSESFDREFALASIEL